MKLIRAFPENPKSDVEFFINPQKISTALIAYLKDTDKFLLWVNVDCESYALGNFDTHAEALGYLTNILRSDY